MTWPKQRPNHIIQSPRNQPIMARASLGSTPLLKLNPFHHHPSRLSLSLYLSSAVHVSTAMPDHHSSLEILGGAAGASFLPALKTLSRGYNPFPLIGWNRHLETIFAALFRSVPDVALRRECLRTNDDGSVALDWVSGDDRALPPDSPLLILLVCWRFCLLAEKIRPWIKLIIGQPVWLYFLDSRSSKAKMTQMWGCDFYSIKIMA